LSYQADWDLGRRMMMGLHGRKGLDWGRKRKVGSGGVRRSTGLCLSMGHH